ncbi:growth hormone receptor-like [Cololabis saira]|uniref:growth hormone receptor-like n=1 Tax=Cololabis saira TaxID=129043 RepID=UPI002AD3454D|nr:growth hormone receptor-like [Cololabis saira]
MAAVLIVLLFFLHAFTASALQDFTQVLPQQQPHFNGCVSTNMETFRCSWNVGAFQNLSEPGDLRIFYIKTKPTSASPQDWHECPHYSSERPNECFFDENHTSIWRDYSVQLRSRDQDVLYDELLFNVQDIVQPDPPVSLNWTLLNMRLTGSYYDIMLSWKPPQSADLHMGWMTLQYEVQYRSASSHHWKTAELVKGTHRSLFGLQTDVNHEVRIRCKMVGAKDFGDFSDSLFVHIPSKVLPQQQPHFTGCVSTNMETFRCSWNVGAFQNLSEPGDLRIFYIKTKPTSASPQDWHECPHYSSERPNECFFDENHTSIWIYYSVQLRSRDQAVLYDELLFNVQDIVQPDPPVSLNWTLLNMSVTGSYYDIMLSWKPPQSADVEMGWMTLQYEVQYRSASSYHWKTADLVKGTHRSLFGLQTDVNHEVRIRCKMLAGKDFGDFSDSVFVHIPSKVLPQQQPHFTGCFSTNTKTFQCSWNVGAFQNLSEPGDLRIFYIKTKPTSASPQDWHECPHYSSERPNECFFDENHTSIWIYYSVQLRSRDQAVLYDEVIFDVSDIVQPDPPVSLNWTLLNMSVTGSYYDIMLSWKPPQSAEVEMGLMRLQYEVQYRSASSYHWKTADLVKGTHRSLFGLQTNVNHEVRIRCKMLGGKYFGDFSDSVFVHIPSKVSRFPGMVLLIIGALCLLAIVLLVIISHQEKLMFILLPRVPGPKIRGMDPDLFKKGKFRELRSILDCPPDLRPELYSDPWVEFIDLDIEEQNDRLTDVDTDCLVDRFPSSHCSTLSVAFKDDDSGRSSCCEPDLLSDSNASSLHPHIPSHTLSQEASCQSKSELSSGVQTSSTEEPCSAAPVREALYTQVSKVRSFGNVLLSPEQQTEVEDNTSKLKGIDNTMEKEKEKKEAQLLVVNADCKGYTSEHTLSEPFQTGGERNAAHSLSSHQEYSTVPMSLLPHAPPYTVVEGVDRENSLLLTPNSTPAPHLTIPKTLPTPDGYLIPELLGSITP